MSWAIFFLSVVAVALLYAIVKLQQTENNLKEAHKKLLSLRDSYRKQGD